MRNKKKTTKRAATESVQAAVHQALSLEVESGRNTIKPGILKFTLPTWARSQSQPKLYTQTASRVTLTGTGRLVLSQALLRDGKGVSIEKLIPFADNEIERDILLLLHQSQPRLLARFHDPLKALCYLKVLHVPAVCRRVLYEFEKRGVGTLSLGALGTCSVAFERVLFEWLFRAAYENQKAHLGRKELHKWANTTLGTTIEAWFDKTSEPQLFWFFRFNQWRDYALRSLIHYFGKQSIDYRRLAGDLKDAAGLGILKHLDALPEEHLSELLDRVQANRAARKVFLQNARKRQIDPPQSEL